MQSVLGKFENLGATSVRVNWRTYGANNVQSNPSCETLRVFRTPTGRFCRHNFGFKTLWRSRPDSWSLKPVETKHLAHLQIDDAQGTFASDGLALHNCSGHHCADSRRHLCPHSSADCRYWGWLPLQPWLQLRHYMTRSRQEFEAKITRYIANTTRKTNPYRIHYDPKHAMPRLYEMDRNWSQQNPCGLDTDHRECIPVALSPKACEG